MKILFVDGTRGFSPNRLEEKAAGGIITSLTVIPRYLARMGHEVYIKSAFDGDEEKAGVSYLGYDTPAPRADVVVFNRNMLSKHNLAQARAAGSEVVWWLHDIVDHRYLNDSAFREVQHIVSLSDYCTRTYADFYGLPHERFQKIPNGIDREIWHPGEYAGRDPNLFVFASAPIKGFRPLQFTMANLQRRLPGLDFRVYSSQQLHDMADAPEIEHWRRCMGQDGAKVSRPIPQRDLAEVFRKAWALLMPNDYPEICSNLILQAQACGLPVVTTPIGSAAEWVRHEFNGLTTSYLPHDKYMWWKDYADQTMRLVTDEKLHRKLSDNAPELPVGWDEIGRRWNEYLRSVVDRKRQAAGVA